MTRTSKRFEALGHPLPAPTDPPTHGVALTATFRALGIFCFPPQVTTDLTAEPSKGELLCRRKNCITDCSECMCPPTRTINPHAQTKSIVFRPLIYLDSH